MSAEVANIVATYEVLAHGSDLSSQTLFTPSADGLFRLSLYANLDSTGTVTAHYTDPASNSINLTAAGASNTKNLNAVFRAKSGNAIAITTVMDTFPFDLIAVLESLD